MPVSNNNREREGEERGRREREKREGEERGRREREKREEREREEEKKKRKETTRMKFDMLYIPFMLLEQLMEY
jgi:hypothetical protein